MTTRSTLFLFCSILLVSSLACFLGCSESGAIRDQQSDSDSVETLNNSPESYASELLDQAFYAASKMPLNPHIKNRSRAQDEVVQAALELGFPARAERFVPQIKNWRRGLGFAAIAYHCARMEAPNKSRQYLKMAQLEVNKIVKEGKEQEWRVDRIVAFAEAAQALLEVQSNTQMMSADQGFDPKFNALTRFALTLKERAAFDNFMAGLRTTFDTEEFSAVQLRFEQCVEIYRCFYADESRRAALEEVVKTSYVRLPIAIRVQLIMTLAEHAIAHEDYANAKNLLSDVRKRIDGARWRARDEIPLRAQIASLRYKAGDADAALADLKATRAHYLKERLRIVSIFRGEALRPLAEAFAQVGQSTTAQELFSLCLDEALENPNSRPRSSDLVSTCVAIARSQAGCNDALKAKIFAIAEELSDPW